MAAPSLVYLRQPHAKERIEMALESLESVPVQLFKSLVSEKLNIPTEQLMLMYAGRVLQAGNTLEHYQIETGVTIFCMTKKIKSVAMDTRTGTGSSQLKRLLQNPRVHQILHRILTNPLLMSSLVRGTPLENSPALQSLAMDPMMQASASDPQELIRLLEANPSQASGIEEMLQSIGAMVAGERGCNRDDVEDEDIVDMLEQSLDDGMDFMDGEGVDVQDAQEQMYQHSQAILAHQQSQTQQMEASTGTSPPPPPLPPRRQNSEPGPATSPGITQNMLANALSSLNPNLMGTYSAGSSGPSSLPSAMASSSSYLQPPQHSMSGPRSLPSQASGGRTGSGDVSPGRSSSTPGSLSRRDLEQALQSVAVATVASSSSQQESHGTATSSQQPPQQHRSERHRYYVQLRHLRSMGVTDEAACIHALEATNGDLNAALELLLGQK